MQHVQSQVTEAQRQRTLSLNFMHLDIKSIQAMRPFVVMTCQIAFHPHGERIWQAKIQMSRSRILRITALHISKSGFSCFGQQDSNFHLLSCWQKIYHLITYALGCKERTGDSFFGSPCHCMHCRVTHYNTFTVMRMLCFRQIFCIKTLLALVLELWWQLTSSCPDELSWTSDWICEVKPTRLCTTNLVLWHETAAAATVKSDLTDASHSASQTLPFPTANSLIFVLSPTGNTVKKPSII